MMLTWGQQLESITDAAVDTAAFGELVTLPTGPVTAIVSLPGLTAEVRERGTTRRAQLEIERQVMPEIQLRTDDAEWLREGEAISVRGTDYRVVSLTPDGTGLTRVELYLPSAQSTAEQARPWR